MRQRTTAEKAVVPVSTVLITLAMLVLVAKLYTGKNAEPGILFFVALAGAVVLGVIAASRHLSATRRVRHELTGAEQYRLLAEEYRRLSDLAITAQEHTDLKLGEVTAQLDHMQARMDALQRILSDIE
jgi:hypothetical protein